MAFNKQISMDFSSPSAFRSQCVREKSRARGALRQVVGTAVMPKTQGLGHRCAQRGIRCKQALYRQLRVIAHQFQAFRTMRTRNGLDNFCHSQVQGRHLHHPTRPEC